MKVLNFYHIGKVIPGTAIYIGRGNVKYGLTQSMFANPFPITKEQTRPEVIHKYRFWLMGEINAGRITIQDILSLEGKDLVCFCSPRACHGDILIKAFNHYKGM